MCNVPRCRARACRSGDTRVGGFSQRSGRGRRLPAQGAPNRRDHLGPGPRCLGPSSADTRPRTHLAGHTRRGPRACDHAPERDQVADVDWPAEGDTIDFNCGRAGGGRADGAERRRQGWALASAVAPVLGAATGARSRGSSNSSSSGTGSSLPRPPCPRPTLTGARPAAGKEVRGRVGQLERAAHQEPSKYPAMHVSLLRLAREGVVQRGFLH